MELWMRKQWRVPSPDLVAHPQSALDYEMKTYYFVHVLEKDSTLKIGGNQWLPKSLIRNHFQQRSGESYRQWIVLAIHQFMDCSMSRSVLKIFGFQIRRWHMEAQSMVEFSRLLDDQGIGPWPCPSQYRFSVADDWREAGMDIFTAKPCVFLDIIKAEHSRKSIGIYGKY